MSPDPDEPLLPYTPSNSGRRARVGYLGFDGVGFNELWPVFAGLVLSIALALKFFVGDGGGGRHWLARTAVAALPFAVGFGYLRVLVVGRPPHFKGDLMTTALALRLDFGDPPFRSAPILPRLVLDQTAESGPARAADLRHPLHGAGSGLKGP
jgi:hypothetical protein